MHAFPQQQQQQQHQQQKQKQKQKQNPMHTLFVIIRRREIYWMQIK
jgi:hypothetical protein